MRISFFLMLALPLVSSKLKEDATYIVVGLGETADGITSDIELIAPDGSKASCGIPNYPFAVTGATFSLMRTLFCGGHNDTHHTNECYAFKDGMWTLDYEMDEKRAYAASYFSDIVGGFNGNKSLASIETWANDSLQQDIPDMPVRVHQHCVVMTELVNFMVVGGIIDGNPSNKTYIYDGFDEVWSEGPELNVPRSGANCVALFTSDLSGQVVVAGGYNNDGYLSSSEIIDFNLLGPKLHLEDDQGWKFGPELPQPLCCAGQLDAFEELYLFGGASADGEFLDTIYLLNSTESGWIKVDAKLKTPRRFPAIGIESLEICEQNRL